MLQSILESHHHTVTVAESGTECLSMLENHDCFSMVLLDVVLQACFSCC